MFQNLLGNVLGGDLHGARPFNVQLRAFSAPFFQGYDADKVNSLNYSGKILLPASCLDWLVRLNIQYPMFFRLTNPNPEAQRCTHVGVLEFLAEEGKCYCPSWVMSQLRLTEGEVVQLEYRSLPTASFAKFKPQTVDFLDISCPRAMLEMKLREFPCLTKNDKIQFSYLDRTWEVLVKELKPADAVSIIECDMNVEFDAPEGYVDPSIKYKQDKMNEEPAPSNLIAPTIVSQEETESFVPFKGAGMRLDGKVKTEKQIKKEQRLQAAVASGAAAVVGVAESGETEKVIAMPDNDYKPGALHFVRNYIRRDNLLAREQERLEAEKPGSSANLRSSGPSSASLSAAQITNVKPFTGSGRSLRDR